VSKAKLIISAVKALFCLAKKDPDDIPNDAPVVKVKPRARPKAKAKKPAKKKVTK
jgi:hypothetical protein